MKKLSRFRGFLPVGGGQVYSRTAGYPCEATLLEDEYQPYGYSRTAPYPCEATQLENPDEYSRHTDADEVTQTISHAVLCQAERAGEFLCVGQVEIIVAE